MIESAEYKAILKFYGDDTAKRSGVRLMNHIDEGLEILENLRATPDAKGAFCIHPIIQNPTPYSIHLIDNCHPYRVFLAAEYSKWANSFLRHHMTETTVASDIGIGEFPEVKQMLIADKLQNKKDFELYHKGNHPFSDELTRYFYLWLTRLGVS